jgi:hypothetical protein
MGNMDDTKILQKTADSLLPLFDDMPSVLVMCRPHEYFDEKPEVAAFYNIPTKHIYFRPGMVAYLDFREGIIPYLKHELIHAWLHWKGIAHMGTFIDKHGHNEWFIKKALELDVDIMYLLRTPEAVHLYNRIAGIWTPPERRGESTDYPEPFNAGVFDEVYEGYVMRLKSVPPNSPAWQEINAEMTDWLVHFPLDNPAGYKPKVRPE